MPNEVPETPAESFDRMVDEARVRTDPSAVDGQMLHTPGPQPIYHCEMCDGDVVALLRVRHNQLAHGIAPTKETKHAQ
jgi:hypothetical protein